MRTSTLVAWLVAAAATVVGMATAPSAMASISITSRFAHFQVLDQACINAQAVCDNHLDPAIDSGTASGPLTFDHTVTQPHASASAGGDEAHADASGHYAVSVTGGGASDLVIATAGALSASAGLTHEPTHQNFATGHADAQSSVSFTLDAPLHYQFAGTASVSGTSLVPTVLAHDDGTGNGARVVSLTQSGQIEGPPTGTLAPGKYIYGDFGAAIAGVSSFSLQTASVSDTWSTKLTLTAGTCDDIRVGQAVAQGCFTETAPGSGVFTTDQQAWVGGFEVAPRPGGKLIVNTQQVSVSSSGAGTDILLDGFPAPFGVEQLPVKLSDLTFDVNQAGTVEKLLLKLPLKGKVKVAWADGGKSAGLDAEIGLADLTGPLGKLVTLGTGAGEGEGKISLKLVNRQGLIVSSAEAKIDELNIIPSIYKVSRTLKLKNVAWKYERKDGKPFWSGQAALSLPLKSGPLDLGIKAFAFDGSLAGGGVSVDGINKEIPDTPLFLQRIGGDLLFRPDLAINVEVGATFGPRLEGKQAFTLDGTLASGALVSSRDCRNGLDPFKLEAKLKLTALEEVPAAKVEMLMRSCGYVGPIKAQDATIQGKLDFGRGLLGYEGTQSGFVGETGFDLEGGVLVRLPLLPDLNGQAIVSNQGIAACANVNFFQGGFAYRWGQGSPATFSGCDLAPFRTTAIRARAQASAAGGSHTFRLPRGLPHVAFAARSSAGAPRVRVTGPGGATFTSPAAGALRSGRVVILPVEAERTTYVVVNDPKSGAWRVASLDPAQPLTSVVTARGLDKPKVTAKVSRRGARRILAYRVRPIPGQRVTFVERAAGGVGHILGRVRGRSGRIVFQPTLVRSPRHTIVAEVTQNGVPRTQLTIAHFTATAPKLRKPKANAKRTRGALTLTWRRVTGAQRYLVEVRGAAVLARVLTTKTKLAVPQTPATGTLTATIRPLSDTTGPGPTTELQIKAARR